MKNDSKWVSLLLDSSGFIVINKALIKVIGTDASLMVGELVSEYNYYEKSGTLTDKEWFYSTQENITENTGLTRHKQENSIKKLVEMKIIETKIMGVPSKKYYKIQFKNLENLLKNAKNALKYQVVKNDKLGCKNLQARMSKMTSKITKNDKQGCQNLQARMSKMTSKIIKNDKQGCQNLQTRMSNMTTNNNNNKNKKKNNKTNLISSREDKVRKETLYSNFLSNIKINTLLEEYKDKPSSKNNLENILNIIKDLYALKNDEYINVRGKKVYAEEIHNILNSYDIDLIDYVLKSIFNNTSDIKNIKAYTIAILLNAPKTINLYYQGKINNDFKKYAEKEKAAI